MKKLLAIITLLALLAPLNAVAAAYQLDPYHTTIQFKVKHLMISNVRGIFEKFNGTVFIDEKDIRKSKVEVKIDTSSINTNIAKRDEHLRSPDFFDTAKYPEMTFTSSRVERMAAGKLRVTGSLTIKGVSRPVVLNIEGPSAETKALGGDIRRGVSASATINRQDFGVSWNKTLDGGGVVVSDKVEIIIDAELVKK